MMRDLGHGPFIEPQKEYEPLVEKRASEAVIEEY